MCVGDGTLRWAGKRVLMSTKTQATIEDLYRAPGKAEIVDGEMVPMSPTGFLPGYAGGEIFASLREYGRRTKVGIATPDNVGFKIDLPNRRSFSPDAAFYVGRPTGMKFLNGAPVFAVEIRSEGDYGHKAEAAIEVPVPASQVLVPARRYCHVAPEAKLETRTCPLEVI